MPACGRSVSTCRATGVVTVIAASALLITGLGVLAHDDSMPGEGQVPPYARDTMRAFAEDHHHDERLSAQSLTSCVGGVAGGYPCSNVDLLAVLPLSQIGGGNGNDIWGWTDPTTGREYALMGLTNGTAFVDITDPINPVYLGHLPPPAGVASSSWRDIKVFADHALIGSEALGSGLQVMDLAQLRSVSAPPVTFVQTAHYTGFSTSHNLVVNEASGYAYAVGTNTGSCNRGLTFIDVFNPASPQGAGCFSSDGYTHDAQCVNYAGPDADYQGREICFAYNEDTLTIVDVTNKAAPVQVSRTGYANRGYTHQGWLTEDHAYLLMDDELDERNILGVTRTLVWDVRNLDQPVHTSDYFAPTSAIDHNQYIVGTRAYQANYRAGLRILDISAIATGTLSEVGFFDIYPADDAANFNGAWSVYPFFPSGNVIVSGIEQGLFILRPNVNTGNDSPVVNIVAPADNAPAALSGTVPIRIDATDAEDAVGSLTVQWNVDGGAWQSAPWNGAEYAASWATTSVLDGAHVVSARAIDSGLREGSDTSNVTVSNGTPAFTVDAVTVTILSGNGARNTGEALVTVAGGASPLSSVAIDGTFSGDWSGTGSGTTDGNGQLQLTTPKVKGLVFVQFCVDLASKAGWSWDAAGSTLCGDSDDVGPAFGGVAGRITDATTGAGVGGAGVSTDTGESATSDGNGAYLIGSVPVGNRTVSVTASGYEPGSQGVSILENTTATVDFALTTTATGGSGAIKGTVSDGTGGKVSDATVQVIGGSSALTNRAGKYSIQNVAAGAQTVIASKPGYLSQQQSVDITAGGSATLDFTLAPE